MAIQPTVSTNELLALLRRHYIKPGQDLPGGVFVPEIGFNGIGGSSRADAIYVGFTSTSGRILVGHELKISRADWVNELNHPGKADAWADQCHEWWLVVSDPEIVRDGELPAGWGLMSPGRSKTRMTVHQKPHRKGADHIPSWNTTRSIISRLDTLRAQDQAQFRYKVQDESRKEIDKRVEEQVALITDRRGGPDPRILQEKLSAVETVLGRRLELEEPNPDAPYRTRNVVTISELERLAELLRNVGTVEEALRALFGPYARPLAHCRSVLDDLESAIGALGESEQRSDEVA